MQVTRVACGHETASQIDIYDRVWAPHSLVRYGVARIIQKSKLEPNVHHCLGADDGQNQDRTALINSSTPNAPLLALMG